VVRHIFQACPVWISLRVTSQASYSPEYITPTQKNHDHNAVAFSHKEAKYQYVNEKHVLSAVCENQKFDMVFQRMDEETPNINNNKLYCKSLVEFTSY
jgi:hypothetical protein